MNSDLFDYRRLPGKAPLFLDFLYDFEKVKEFYGDSHCSLEKLKRRAERIRSSGREYPRQEMADILKKFNESAGAGEEAMANIEKLRAGEAVAVFSGQQLGLFGGPSYTFHKAATAVRLARLLCEEGIEAVPVFWLPSNDSDLDEVRATRWFDRRGDLFQVEFDAGDVPKEQMVGPTPLQSIEDCFQQLEGREIPGQFAGEVVKRLRQVYQEECDFSTAYARWLGHVFSGTGLVLFDALCEGYKQLAAPVFRAALEKRSEIAQALMERSEELEAAGYKPQVHCDQGETLLFWVDGDCRYKLRFEEGRYLTKQGHDVNGDLEGALESGLGRLGPNVLLRPLVQDWLFPTVTYVGGPSEVAYFAQVQAIAPFFDIEPAVFPRAGLTVVDRKAQRFLDKHEISFEDILDNPRLDITRRIAERGESSRILKEFEEFQQSVDERLQRLDELIRSEDPPVADMLKGAGNKIGHQIQRVHDRFVKNQERRDDVLKRHMDYLYAQLLPQGKLQERVVNFNQFLALEGPTLVERLIGAIDPFARGHRVFFV